MSLSLYLVPFLRYSTSNDDVTLKSGRSRSLEMAFDRSRTSSYWRHFHSNILYHFRDKARYWSKIASLHIRHHSMPLLGRKLRICYSFRHNTRTWLTPDRETGRQTDGQTDRRTDAARQHTPRLCVASRGKNEWTDFATKVIDGATGKEMKRTTLGLTTSRSHDAQVRFGDLAESWFWTPWVE